MSRSRQTISKAMDDLRSDYDFHRESRFIRRRTGLASGGGPADYHVRNETKFYDGIEKCRDIDRNDLVVGQALTRKADNLIQDGFTLEPRTGDKKLDETLYAMWQEYASDPDQCDASCELTFPEMEKTTARTISVDGDLGVAGLDDGPLQMHEAHTVKKRRKQDGTFLGVTIDKARRRTKFWIQPDGIDPAKSGLAETSVPIPVRNDDGIRQFFHVYTSHKRISLTRGMSDLGRVFGLSGMVDDINFAKMLQQQISSCFALIEEQAAIGANDGQPLPSLAPSFGEATTETSATGEQRTINGIQPGMFFRTRPGSKMKMESAGVPNEEFFDHIRLLLQLLGVNLGMPLIMMLLDGSETNFSGFRGAMDEARRGFRAEQRQLIRRFHSPVYIWRVNHLLKRNAEGIKGFSERKKVDIFGHAWHPPTWPYIEPLTDAGGDLLRMRNHLTSPRRIFAEKSLEFETVTDESVADNGYRIEGAIKEARRLNSKYPPEIPSDRVSWRDVLQGAMPDGVQISIPVGKPPESQPKQDSSKGGKPE